MSDQAHLDTGQIVIHKWIDEHGSSRVDMARTGDAQEILTAVAMLTLAQDRVLHPRKEPTP